MMDTPARTLPGYARRLKNCFYRGGSWVWRSGVKKVHSVNYAYPFVWAGANKTVAPGISTWTLLGATGNNALQAPHFTRLVGSAMVQIPYNGVSAPDFGDNDEWRTWEDAPTSDTVRYACRRPRAGTGVLYHIAKDQVTAAGIPKPTAPVVIDSAGAGVLPAGSYPYAYRYKTADGDYSPWTDPLVAAIGANKKRAWTIANSPHPRVTGKQLGVGFASGDVRNVYLVAEIEDNTTTTFEEDTLPAAYDIEVPADFDLAVPPDSPEDASKWDGKLWLISNDPEPLLWNSNIDAAGASNWNLFNPLVAQKLPIGGGQRYQCFKPWDRTRAAVLTDGSAHIVEPTSGGQYTIESLDDNHGCVSADSADVGSGVLCWFDGRNIMASRGRPGDSQIVSRGWVDKALAQIPDAYKERVIVRYVPNDGGAFWICIPSAAASTGLDLVLCWRPEQDEWHTRSYYGDAENAPLFISQILSPFAGWLTVGGFDDSLVVVRLDDPSLRDEGLGSLPPQNIQVEIETAQVPVPDGFGSVAVARQHIGVRRRVDTTLPNQNFVVSCDVSLNVNGTETTPVTAIQQTGVEYISALAQNLDAPASDVTIVMRFDHPDALEVFDVIPEAVYYKREMART